MFTQVETWNRSTGKVNKVVVRNNDGTFVGRTNQQVERPTGPSGPLAVRLHQRDVLASPLPVMGKKRRDRPQNSKTKRSAERVQKVLDLRQGSTAQPHRNKKRYSRSDPWDE
jgi:hypothetical protein